MGRQRKPVDDQSLPGSDADHHHNFEYYVHLGIPYDNDHDHGTKHHHHGPGDNDILIHDDHNCGPDDNIDIDVYTTVSDDELDLLAEPIVEAVLSDMTLRNMLIRLDRVGYEYQRFEGQTYGALKTTFAVAYVIR